MTRARPSVSLVLCWFNGRGAEIIKHVAQGAATLRIPYRTSGTLNLSPGEVLIAFGARPYSLERQRAAARAGALIQIDHSWFPDHRAGGAKGQRWRFAWNGLQPDPDHLVARPRNAPVPMHPRSPRGDLAMVALQSIEQHTFLNLPESQHEWAAHQVRALGRAGYRVTLRAKPPRGANIATALDDVSLVLSRNSGASMVAALNGVPGVCVERCALSIICPADVPPPNESWTPNLEAIKEGARRLAGYEFYKDEWRNGVALKEVLNVPYEHRVGVSTGGCI